MNGFLFFSVVCNYFHATFALFVNLLYLKSTLQIMIIVFKAHFNFLLSLIKKKKRHLAQLYSGMLILFPFFLK